MRLFPQKASAAATAAAAGLVLLVAPAVRAEEDRFASVEIEAQHVAGSVHMLTGLGGNMGVSVGEDGVLLIDDQYAPLSARILAAIEALGGARPRIVLNTHVHGDHVGGNAFFGAAGTIIAHQNVRLRLTADDTARTALPLVTFEDRLQIHFNDDEIDVIHLPAGHTDTDSIVWFKNANVVHVGDLMRTGKFPYVDLDRGGSVDGFLAALEAVLDLVPEDVRIIPGHGGLASVVDLAETIDMIRATREAVRGASDAGRSRDDIVSAGLDPRWAGFDGGMVSAERWIDTLLAAAPAAGEAVRR